MNMGVTDFTRKTGVFFAYGVDGPEFPPALYCTTVHNNNFTRREKRPSEDSIH